MVLLCFSGEDNIKTEEPKQEQAKPADATEVVIHLKMKCMNCSCWVKSLMLFCLFVPELIKGLGRWMRFRFDAQQWEANSFKFHSLVSSGRWDQRQLNSILYCFFFFVLLFFFFILLSIFMSSSILCYAIILWFDLICFCCYTFPIYISIRCILKIANQTNTTMALNVNMTRAKSLLWLLTLPAE